jgi:hypothetical protein
MDESKNKYIDIYTDTSSAPFAGYRIFSLKSWVAVPKTVGLLHR